MQPKDLGAHEHLVKTSGVEVFQEFSLNYKFKCAQWGKNKNA